VVIDTDPLAATDAGGYWWDVAVPEFDRAEVREARTRYEVARASAMREAAALKKGMLQ
jgi:3D-(3,5/4)-trihydroxycyclohexane-1,2-dione acylhydrolase (decyclizing)